MKLLRSGIYLERDTQASRTIHKTRVFHNRLTSQLYHEQSNQLCEVHGSVIKEILLLQLYYS